MISDAERKQKRRWDIKYQRLQNVYVDLNPTAIELAIFAVVKLCCAGRATIVRWKAENGNSLAGASFEKGADGIYPGLCSDGVLNLGKRFNDYDQNGRANKKFRADLFDRLF